MDNMYLRQIATEVAERHKVNRLHATSIIAEAFQVISEMVEQDKKVIIYDFGTFSRKWRPGRPSYNLIKGDVTYKPGRWLLHVKTAQKILTRYNGR